ncbi:GNAT family N-acetyltransferase [Nocardioides donggukensis]|uniref:GNAT family N-acetyltransferase n=1 Tax=Nocardioides donggukensis TaxID=2774019 RepID=A0A927PZP0_9ACTN|nr:GNAT family N-acetyltransferase [Nocardioides donggukensis]MBD8869505.1 GNAT family N-acetyltransferase [Nocardioides donggukensis]
MAVWSPAALTPRQQEAWRALADRAACPNAFLRPEFVVPAATHLPVPSTNGAVQLLTVSQEGRLLSLLPFVRGRWRRVPLPAMGAWVHDQQGLATPLLARGADLPVAASLLVEAVSRVAPRARLLGLDEQTTGLPVDLALDGALSDAGWRSTVWHSYRRALLTRDGDRVGGGATLRELVVESSRLRTKRRRLDREAGPLRVLDASAPALASGAAESFLRLEDAGWKGRAGTSMLQRPGEADMLREVVRRAADVGSLRLLVLAGADAPLATQIDLVCGDTHFHWKTAYDERWQRMSPGRLLLTHVLERFAASDLRRLDGCTVEGHPVLDPLLPSRRVVTSRAWSRGAGSEQVVRSARWLRTRLRAPAPVPTIGDRG